MINLENKNNKQSKKIWLVLLALIILAIGFFIWRTYFASNQNNIGYEAERTSTENKSDNDSQDNNTENSEASSDPSPTPQEQPKEEQIALFSTTIYNKEAARQNNVNLTCNALNGTVVKNGETFSFCNTVGPATEEKGYQKADIFDKNGNKRKGLGGGNCQISSTLYNAVLLVPNLNVTERHQHSNYVPYIQMGKDAAVAYGGYDLKFVNQTGYNIKIQASSDGNTVTTSINKVV